VAPIASLKRVERRIATTMHASRNQVAVAAALIFLGQAFSRSAHGAEPLEAKKVFNQRCTACHTFGKGIKVGPDLKGIAERRPRPWIIRFVRSSRAVIATGDPIANQLFKQFKQQRMPDWPDLSEVQVGLILDWLAKNGPEQKPPDERHAETATAAEIETGRSLFHGARPLSSGGLPCSACHRLERGDDARGGTMGPALTSAYLEYEDTALTRFLRRPCFPRAPELSTAEYLTPEESFALKALLRQVAVTDRKRGAP
jgi:mono/diheme cytochrome c family protein